MGELIIGALFLIILLFVCIQTWLKVTRPLFFRGVADGQVVSVSQREDKTTHSKTDIPVITFITEDGERVSSVPAFLSPPDRFQVGEYYLLRYNTQNPQEFILKKGRSSIMSFPVLILSIMVVTLLLGLFVVMKQFFV